MHKNPTINFAGCDVSARWLDLVAECRQQGVVSARFDNTATGHKALCRWLTPKSVQARIVVEATGIYSLDLALALEAHPRIEVMVVNPRALKDFARATMRRSKTDPVDAATACQFAQRMPFVLWQPPAPELLELRALARRIAALVVEQTREKNRHHATAHSQTSSTLVRNDIEVNLRHLKRRIDLLSAQALRLITAEARLKDAYDHLVSVRGIALRSAVQILPEVLLLPPAMTVRQWVAHAGLDPCAYKSGSSIDRPSHISKMGSVQLRRALYMPALVAIQSEPHVKAFYERRLAQGHQPLEAIVAVMRKLLHAIYGMLKHDQDFEGQKFYRLENTA